MIQKPRITLDPFTQETLQCAPELFALIDKNHAYLRNRLPWLDDITSLEETKQYIKRALQKHNNGEALYALIYNSQKELMGTIRVKDLLNKAITDFAYWIGEAFQGQGYMSCACIELIQLIKHKNIPTLKKLMIQCEPDNIASARIAQKCGFTYSHRLKNEASLYGKPIDLDIYTFNLAEHQ